MADLASSQKQDMSATEYSSYHIQMLVSQSMT